MQYGDPTPPGVAVSYDRKGMQVMKKKFSPYLAAAFAALLLGGADESRANAISQDDMQARPSVDLPLSGNQGLVAPVPVLHTTELSDAVESGRWSKACSIATKALANENPDLESLGIFAICEALVNNASAVAQARYRLNEMEVAPRRYSLLADGVLLLRNGKAEAASSAFARVLAARHEDTIALYFSAEALHSLRRDKEAISALRQLLKVAPDNAAALAANARLVAGKGASASDLKQAISLTEHATQVEPMNRALWKQLAQLYDRTGQRGRAAAIMMQWVALPHP